MSFEQLKLVDAEANQFLENHFGEHVTGVVPLSGGNWSQAFAFKRADEDLVIRFGRHHEDYLVDRFASQFSDARLPIPKVLEVGEFSDGYFAISERAFGAMIDDLSKDEMQKVIPSLMNTLDAMREADISHTTGYGPWDVNGNGRFSSWREMLLDINNDKPGTKKHGWRKGLRESPVGDGVFDEAYARLVDLSADLPETRSLVHNDLMHFNVLTNDNQITAVFDWANAMYGDFLYDLAMLTFWGPMHEPIKGIDWEQAARDHYKAIGLDLPEFERRLQCCMIHIGLDSMAYYGFKKNWEWIEPVAKRTLEVAKSAD